MPELPEVEVVRQGLAPLITGQRIVAAGFSGKRLRYPFPRGRIKRQVLGERIKAVQRRGRYLILLLSNQARLLIHLGMTGRLALVAAAAPRKRHDHVWLRLGNQQELRFNDPRRFGFLLVLSPDDRQQENPLARLGPEPLAADFSVAWLRSRAGQRRLPIKTFLMDNRVVAGIGNIYANEILFAAGLHPATKVCDLAAADWQRLIDQSRRILSQAIASGGSTIADYRRLSGEPGLFQLRFQVYGRTGEPCPRCATPIAASRISGRATFFCPRCQPLA